MRFTIVSSGALRAAWRIQGLARQAANVRPAMEEIYMMILDIEEEIFQSQGTRGGREGWTPLSLGWQRKKFSDESIGHVGILEYTGLLRDTVTRWRHPMQYTRIERSKIVFRSQRPFADLHQKGKGGMPQRQWIYFTKQDAMNFAQEIKDHIMQRTSVGPSLNAG